MRQRSLRHNNSGQVLIVASLLIALILLSTALFVIEVGKDVPKVASDDGDVFAGYRQTARNTLISALSNRTRGGSDVLAQDLAQLNAVITSHSYQTLLSMDYMLQNSDGYQNGLLILWGTGGQGVSSASATFSYAYSSSSASADAEYVVTVTSAIGMSGNYTQLDGNLKEFHLTVSVSNEGQPALVDQFTLSYQNATEWVTVNSPTIIDYGDGVYAVTFDAETDELAAPVVVSLQCIDQRGISVGAKVTCNSI